MTVQPATPIGQLPTSSFDGLDNTNTVSGPTEPNAEPGSGNEGSAGTTQQQRPQPGLSNPLRTEGRRWPICLTLLRLCLHLYQCNGDRYATPTDL